MICYSEHVRDMGNVLEQEGEKEFAARLTVPGELMRGSGLARAARGLGVFPSIADVYSDV